jgi:hypothetical protein
MSDQFTMFGPTISSPIASVISSPESESGATPCDSPDGKTNAKSGPDRAPASHSRTPEKKKRSTTRGIFGQSGFLSSEHDDLSYALASRLRPLTDSLGSTLFTLTWTTRITPAGRSICALRASERRTGDSVCIGWPTPRAREAGPDYAITDRPESGGLSIETTAALAAWTTPSASDADRAGAGITEAMSGSSLVQMAAMAGWASPKARDHKTESPAACSAERMAEDPPDLSKQVQLATWPTPRAEDAESSGMRHTRGVADTMTAVASLCGWPTPTIGDTTGGGHVHAERVRPSGATVGSLLKNTALLVRVTDSGEGPIGFLLVRNGWEIVPASGQLRPEHSRWLMGLPPDWDDCAVTAMASLRKSRRRS